MTTTWMVSKINKYPKTTTKHTHKVTITITKQCGGTPVSFASVLFNLEHKQKIGNYVVSFYVPILPFLCLSMLPWSDWWIHLFIYRYWSNWVTHIASRIIFELWTLFGVDTYIFIAVSQFNFFLLHSSNSVLSIWWNPPFKDGFLSIWIRCTRWSGWLYHCNVFSYRHGQW